VRCWTLFWTAAVWEGSKNTAINWIFIWKVELLHVSQRTRNTRGSKVQTGTRRGPFSKASIGCYDMKPKKSKRVFVDSCETLLSSSHNQKCSTSTVNTLCGFALSEHTHVYRATNRVHHMVCGAEFTGQPVGATAPQQNVWVADRLKTKTAQVAGGTVAHTVVHSEPHASWDLRGGKCVLTALAAPRALLGWGNMSPCPYPHRIPPETSGRFYVYLTTLF